MEKKKFNLFGDLTETWKGFKTESVRPLTMILVIVNVVCLLISNIIAAKTFTLFTVGTLEVTLPTALILYPVAITVSDMLGEIDYIWTRRSCHLGFILNLVMVGIFELAIIMPGSVDLSVLHSTSFVLFASMISFYFGDLINDTVFLKLKTRDGEGNKLILRCVLSTVLGQLVDSTIFISLGMNIFPRIFLGFAFMSWPQVLFAIIFQILIKTAYEFILSPVIIRLCKKARKVEEK